MAARNEPLGNEEYERAIAAGKNLNPNRIYDLAMGRSESVRDAMSRRRKSHVSSHIPNRHHRTNPTPPDQSDNTGQRLQ
jgi:hypothetical protein